MSRYVTIKNADYQWGILIKSFLDQYKVETEFLDSDPYCKPLQGLNLTEKLKEIDLTEIDIDALTDLYFERVANLFKIEKPTGILSRNKLVTVLFGDAFDWVEFCRPQHFNKPLVLGRVVCYPELKEFAERIGNEIICTEDPNDVYVGADAVLSFSGEALQYAANACYRGLDRVKEAPICFSFERDRDPQKTLYWPLLLPVDPDGDWFDNQSRLYKIWREYSYDHVRYLKDQAKKKNASQNK